MNHVVVFPSAGWEVGTICSESSAMDARGHGAIVLPYDEEAEREELAGAAPWAVRIFGKGYTLPSSQTDMVLCPLPLPTSPDRRTLHFSIGMLPDDLHLGKVLEYGPANVMAGRFQILGTSVLGLPGCRLTGTTVMEPSRFPKLDMKDGKPVPWNVSGSCSIESQGRVLSYLGIKGSAPGARLLWLAVSTTA